MTSDEIKQEIAESKELVGGEEGKKLSSDFLLKVAQQVWLAEIAYHLAVMNERAQEIKTWPVTIQKGGANE